MSTFYLKSLFKNYFLSVAHCHLPLVESKLEKISGKILVDVFARMPELEAWTLCWSAPGSNTVNRVFIPQKDAAFHALTKQHFKIHFAQLANFARKDIVDNDVALYCRKANVDTVVFYPLWSQEHGLFGVVRLIGNHADLAAEGYTKDTHVEPSQAVCNLDVPDSDLLPHILGRWAGAFFGHRETTKPLAVLLKSFGSFFPSSHVMYWTRDFEKNEIGFHFSPTPNTDRILSNFKASIHSHDYMFTIIAERGASEIIENFPEDLSTDLRINPSSWKPSSIHGKLCDSLGIEMASYIGVPLKVDDCVIGVVSLLVKRDEPAFKDCARFVRSALAEMGRTVDKTAVIRTSRLIRQFVANKSGKAQQSKDLRDLGSGLVLNLVKELIPYGSSNVGVVQARVGGEEREVTGLPSGVAMSIQKQLIEFVLSEEIHLKVVDSESAQMPIKGVMVIPIPSGIPFVLFIYAPLALLIGRTLRSAIQQLQAVLLVSIAASEKSSALGQDIGNWREHLALWAEIHDIKNATAAFSIPLMDLVQVAECGTISDIKTEVLEFKEKFSKTILGFEEKCDQTLSGAGFRQREDIIIYDVVRRAWFAILAKQDDVKKNSKARYVFETRPNLSAVTFSNELEIVVFNLLLNVANHFRRVGRYGNITIKEKLIESPKGNEIMISISDNVSESNAADTINNILDDPYSKRTLKRYIKPVVERQLQGRIWAELNSEAGSAIVFLGIPQQVTTH